MANKIFDDVVKRLEMFGYSIDLAADEWALNFAFEKVQNYIFNTCNISEIPEELTHVAVDMTCGEFLLVKKNSGQLDGFEVDLDSVALKSKSQGDTSFSFAADKTMSVEERIDALIAHLLDYSNPELVQFRRLKW